MPVPNSLQNSLLWPIHVKGAIIRHSPAGDPKIEKVYHAALEDGRFLERNLGDANNWIAEKKKDLLEKVSMYAQLVSVGTDAQLPLHPRRFKLAADVINILKEINKFQTEIIGLISALTHNVGVLQSMEQNILQMIQANLNSVANLIHEVCNWGLPDLPAIPNFFSDTLWNWNGFNFFPLAAFQPHVGFDFNFAFNQCVIHIPNINIFRNYPSTVQTYSGLTYGTPFFVPPLGGIIPNTGQNLSDPNFVAQLQQNTGTPVFGPTFNPNSSMLGSLPDASTIISNYQLPAQTYQDNILTLVPDTRSLVIEPTDPDYNNPDLVTRQADEAKALAHFVTLKAVVASNYDLYLTSAWIYFLNSTRTGRIGNWLPNLEQIFVEVFQPSINVLTTTPVPYNNFTGTVRNTPTDIPFVDLVKSLPNALLQNLLWKLSYVEAGMLGYPRTKDWDAAADPIFLSTFTGSDLDYATTPIDPVLATVILGQDTAEFPVFCQFPTSFNTTMNATIAQATLDIQNTPGYKSPHPQYRFVYDQFAQSKMVDRFSQFWREFNNNVVVFLAQDPYLVGQAASYEATLNAAVNPLADPTPYQALQLDAATRNRAWVRGTPLLNIPKAPVVTYSNSTLPDQNNNGWAGLALNAEAFLSRPDIQGQPIPVQLAMLRTNLSYASIQKFSQDMQAEVAQQISQAQTIIASFGELGFHVTANTVVTTVPVGPAGIAISFDSSVPPNDFDYTNNVTTLAPGLFTIQAAGQYAIAGQFNWGSGAQGLRIVTITQNGTPIFSQETDPVVGPVTEQFTTNGFFNVGDIVQVVASTDLGVSTTIGAGSFFTMMQTDTNAPIPTPAGNNASTRQFTAGENFTSLTAVSIRGDGDIIPVNPSVIDITNVSLTTNIVTITAVNKYFPGDYVIVSGLTTATFLNGQLLLLTGASPTQFTAAFVHANYPSTPDTGQAQQAIDASGKLLAPFVDGVSTTTGVLGNSVNVATNYGGTFQVTGATFTVGGLLYVKPDGSLTQDFNSLITGVFGAIFWVICVGRAATVDTFIFEPHIPIRKTDVL